MLDWHTFTWLGDSGLLLPAAAFVLVWLASSRRTWYSAVLWTLCFGACGAIVALSKLAFMGWGLGDVAFDFTGFSGHTALSSCFWPVALWLLASRGGHRLRVAAACAGWLLGAAIGVSRLAIDAHSVSEVVAGFLVGAAASGLFLVLQHTRPHPQLPAWWVAASLAVPMVLLPPGQRAPTHGLLERVAAGVAGLERPYTRVDLHAGTHPMPRARAGKSIF
ncbi:phosphatase PAP2 family protein [Xenophilus aerolatus]|nr:phosphatase PAP2 family protein [Xenophilus aerolatus]